jgi:peroxiredoxin
MKFLFLFAFITILNISYSQNCFDDYDLLFENGKDTLPYNEFHKFELKFLDNLKGCDAIDFSASTIDNEEIILSELRGKVVVLNFWFTTCLPCLKEIPELNKLVENNDSDEVVFIGLAREDKKILLDFFSKFGEFNYKIIPQSYNIANSYKVIAWPQSMVIDKSGKIYNSWAGIDKKPKELILDIQNSIDHCLNSTP